MSHHFYVVILAYPTCIRHHWQICSYVSTAYITLCICMLWCKRNIKSFPSHMGPQGGIHVRFCSFGQTLAYAARPWIQGNCITWCASLHLGFYTGIIVSIYTAWWQAHGRENSPEIVTWQRSSRESNSQPSSCKSNDLTNRLMSHLHDTSYKKNFKIISRPHYSTM